MTDGQGKGMEPSDPPQGQSFQRPTKRPRVVAACLRCKTRRQKCDNQLPACSNCARAKLNCVFPENEYPSHYVKALESRVAWLETQLGPSHPSQSRDHLSTSSPATAPGPEGGSTSVATATSPVNTAPNLANSVGLLSLHAGGGDPQYFGVSSGVSLARMIETAVYENARPSSNLSVLADMTESPFPADESGAQTKVAPLPPPEIGASFITAYLSYIQPNFPFIPKAVLWEAHQNVRDADAGTTDEAKHKHHFVMINMVYAIGSRCSQLVGSANGTGAEPEGYYRAAMANIQDQLNLPSIQNIQIILLVAIYALRSPSRSSIWHLCSLMIRQCLELGLHKQQKSDEKSISRDEFKKRLFWSIYHLERRTALVLGRPMAITDDEIDIALPQYVTDDDRECSPPLPDAIQQQRTPTAASETGTPASTAQDAISFHAMLIMLDQLNTKSRLTLCRLAKASPGPHVEKKITKRFQALEDWKSGIFGSPTSKDSAGESADLMSFTARTTVQTPISRPALPEGQRIALLLSYHRARRLLLQTILTDVPLPHKTFPFASFAKSSGEVCQLNRRLHRLKPVPFTLLDLHSVFVAGFSMIFCVWNDPQLYDTEMAADFGACSTVLYLIAEQWGAGAKKYRDAFELVAEKTAEYVTSARRPRDGGQHLESSVGQQSQVGGGPSAHENGFVDGTHQQSNVYDVGGNGGDGWGNDSFDVWQTLNQCLHTDDGSFQYDTVDFTGIEEFLVEEGLGWFNGPASFYA